MVRVKDRPSGAAPSAVVVCRFSGGGREGGLAGGRCKYVHVSSIAACSCALSCAHGKARVGRPAQPARGMPRAHAAHAPSQPTLPATDNFLRTAGRSQRKKQKQKPVLQAFVSTKVDTYQSRTTFRQTAGICRRRGGSGCGGVRGMDAAAKPPWTDSRRPPQPDPPRQPTECRLLLLLLLLLRRVQGAALPETLPSQQASATAARVRPSHASSRPEAASRPPATGIAA